MRTLARLLAQQGYYQEAAETLVRLVELQPTFVANEVRYQPEGDLVQMVKWYDQAGEHEKARGKSQSRCRPRFRAWRKNFGSTWRRVARSDSGRGIMHVPQNCPDSLGPPNGARGCFLETGRGS